MGGPAQPLVGPYAAKKREAALGEGSKTTEDMSALM